MTVVNPGNPTGVSLPRDVLQQIVDICGKHGVWLVLDCTYEHFDHLHGSDTFAGFPEKHVIHIFSFSKGHALGGISMWLSRPFQVERPALFANAKGARYHSHLSGANIPSSCHGCLAGWTRLGNG